jgi:long-subunit fatty acid transport protein
MGQAFLAISDDGTAGSWTPAGLYIHERTLTSVSYSFLEPRGTFTYHFDNGVSEDFDHGGSIGALNYASIVSPIRIKGHHFVLNLSGTRNFDTYYKFGDNLFGDWTGVEPNAFYEREGGLNSVNFGFGTRFYKQLSIGFSGNVYYGKVVTSETRHFERDTVYYTPGGYALFATDVEIIDSTKYSGFNAVLGMMYSGDKLRAGLTVRTPFNLRGESDTTHYMISTKNGVGTGLDVEQGFELFVTDTIYVDNITSKIEVPMIIGFGLGYDVNDKWLVAGDVEYKKFSGKKVKQLVDVVLTAGGESIESFSDYDPNWSDVWQIRLGTEYMFNTSIGEIPVRCGFRNEAYPEGNVVAYSIEYKGPEDAATNDSTRISYDFTYGKNSTTGLSFSLGTGLHWSQILLDFAYTYTAYDQQIYSSADVLRSENEWKNHHLNMTFTGYF